MPIATPTPIAAPPLRGLRPVACSAALLFGCAGGDADSAAARGEGSDALIGRSITSPGGGPEAPPEGTGCVPWRDVGPSVQRDGGPGPSADAGASPVPDADAESSPAPEADGGAPLPAADAAALPLPEPEPEPDAAPAPVCGVETCNGQDDDCDGTVDEHGACGPYVEAHCRLFLGWADERRGPAGRSPVWGPCPAADAGRSPDGEVRCASTRRTGGFLMLDLDGDVNGDDQLGMAFQCDPAPDAAVSAWLETHCALFLGHADDGNGAPDGSAEWGPCPASTDGVRAPRRCTSTGFDRQFRTMNLSGNVDDNDDVGVAFVCRAPDAPERAAAVQAAVEVFFGQADENRAPPDGSPTWGTCPGAVQPNQGEIRCVGTAGDGRFHRLRMEGDVDGNDALGLALRARRVP